MPRTYTQSITAHRPALIPQYDTHEEYRGIVRKPKLTDKYKWAHEDGDDGLGTLRLTPESRVKMDAIVAERIPRLNAADCVAYFYSATTMPCDGNKPFHVGREAVIGLITGYIFNALGTVQVKHSLRSYAKAMFVADYLGDEQLAALVARLLLDTGLLGEAR